MNNINQIEKNDSNTEYDENQNIKIKFNLPSNKGSNCESNEMKKKKFSKQKKILIKIFIFFIK